MELIMDALTDEPNPSSEHGLTCRRTKPKHEEEIMLNAYPRENMS